MGTEGGWLSAPKKVLSSSKKSKQKKKCPGQEKNQDVVSLCEETFSLAVRVPPPLHVPPLPAPPKGYAQFTEAENEHSKHADDSAALATAVAAEAAVAADEAAAEVVRLTTVAPYPGKSKEEIAATRFKLLLEDTRLPALVARTCEEAMSFLVTSRNAPEE